MSEMIKIIVDDVELEVEAGMSVLQACEESGAEIPRFCYHERLSVAGNCRMCLVNVEGAPKPIASCAASIAPNMKIDTKSEAVQEARKGVMEFLLINHPLDCPICDQGGECDLQDQALGYGKDESRFIEPKRAVEDKNMGPLVKTIMSRCIHCTRCVRFVTEVAGVSEIGATGRGEDMEITTYLEASLSSELSGNVIDLCPVGALTSKPYAFTARPWELKKTDSIDISDAVGTNITLQVRDGQVKRIVPRLNEEVNEEWASDKTRFLWDGLASQRLDHPYIRQKNGKLVQASWKQAFASIAKQIKGKDPKSIGAITGNLSCAESMQALKDLMINLGSPNIDCRQDGSVLSGDVRANYLFNTGFSGIEDADALLLIGCNPRWEAAVLNARIRKAWLHSQMPIFSIGKNSEFTYDVNCLGDDHEAMDLVSSATNKVFKRLKKAKKPMLILGQSILARSDGNAILAQAIKLAENTGMVTENWNGFNVLHYAASRVAGLDLGILPQKGGMNTNAMLNAAEKGTLETLFLLGSDEIDMQKIEKSFVIYIGSHGDAGAHHADVILPSLAYSEKQALYVNAEGRVQMTQVAASSPKNAKEEWKIFRALSDVLGVSIEYNTIDELRCKLYQVAPHLEHIDTVYKEVNPPKAPKHSKINSGVWKSAIEDFYLTDVISRASKTMAECSLNASRRSE